MAREPVAMAIEQAADSVPDLEPALPNSELFLRYYLGMLQLCLFRLFYATKQGQNAVADAGHSFIMFGNTVDTRHCLARFRTIHAIQSIQSPGMPRVGSLADGEAPDFAFSNPCNQVPPHYTHEALSVGFRILTSHMISANRIYAHHHNSDSKCVITTKTGLLVLDYDVL